MNTTVQTSAPARNVRMVANKTTGALVTPSSNPEYGYLQLEETADEFGMGWMRTTKKSTLVRAEVTALQKLVAENRTGALPGKIVVQEYPENEVPDPIFKAFLSSKKQSSAELAEQYVKRAGNGGAILMTGDQRILRFTWYDRSGLTPDIKCEHDNGVAAPAQPAVAEAVTEQFDPALPGA